MPLVQSRCTMHFIIAPSALIAFDQTSPARVVSGGAAAVGGATSADDDLDVMEITVRVSLFLPSPRPCSYEQHVDHNVIARTLVSERVRVEIRRCVDVHTACGCMMFVREHTDVPSL